MWRWYIVGAYIAPKDTTTMERVVEAIQRKPRGAELLVVGDFNVDIAAPEGDRRAEDIATELATAELEDMARHFLPREKRWCRDRRTWEFSGRDGRCGPGRITSWVQTAVSSEISPSGTLGTTRTITWS